MWANNGRRGLHWVKRDVLQLPKGMGGLGVRKSSLFNSALLMKQVWRIFQNPQLLLSKVYSAYRPPALKSGRPNVFSGSPMSWGMRGLRKAENILLSGCC